MSLLRIKEDLDRIYWDKAFGKFHLQWRATDDNCPRLGAWFAWDTVVKMGFVVHLGSYTFGVWYLREELLDGP